MTSLVNSIKMSIERRLTALEEEENHLLSTYQSKMKVANDSYYVSSARHEARRQADQAQKKLDIVIDRKIMLLKELRELEK